MPRLESCESGPRQPGHVQIGDPESCAPSPALSIPLIPCPGVSETCQSEASGALRTLPPLCPQEDQATPTQRPPPALPRPSSARCPLGLIRMLLSPNPGGGRIQFYHPAVRPD